MKYKFAIFSLIVLLLLALGFLMVFIYKGLNKDEGDVLVGIFSPFIGTLATALITMLLLNSQTEAKTKVHTTGKTFEKKLDIYQEYLQALCDIVNSQKLTEKASIQIQFQTSNIAMHTSAEHLGIISESVKQILAAQHSQFRISEDRSTLLRALFEIVSCFREELYEKDVSPEVKKAWNSKLSFVIKNFCDSYKIRENLNESTEDYVSSRRPNAKNHIWQVAVEDWNSAGWELIKPAGKAEKIVLQNTRYNTNDGTDNPVRIQVEKSEKSYIIKAFYKTQQRFVRGLEMDFKDGNHYSGCWWRTLSCSAIPQKWDHFFASLTNGTNPKDELVQNCVINWIHRLFVRMKHHDQTEQRINSLKNRLSQKANSKNPKETYLGRWEIYPYHFTILACEYRDAEEEGTPYIDVLPDEKKERVVITLWNRRWDDSLLKKTLERMAQKEKPRHLRDKKTETYRTIKELIASSPTGKPVVLESLAAESTPDDIADKLISWMTRVDKSSL